MRFIALGGGSEVGASCNLLQMDHTNILLDAGIRMGGNPAGGATDVLPDLALLQEAGGVDAILISHAHMDHIGALPLVHRAYPTVPIYATTPTVHLMRVLLADSLKIMSIKAEQELECPLYDEELVTKMFSRVVPVPMGGQIVLPGGVQISFFPAGHILGAAMLGLDGAAGRVLYTGDISMGNQRTIAGLAAPDFAPHVLIMESTYGNRLHANRQREEKTLAHTVAEVIASGGHALIPAFALGRAQEIILLIAAHQQAGLIPQFPIWVDGMVRSICQAYLSFPESLRGPLKKLINNGSNPFFSAKGLARQVTTAPMREKVLAGAPSCIIASSGMLTGGPSQFYASRLVGDPRQAIIFCGYQDEESPGRQLLALADNPEATITLGGVETKVQCRIARYGLSAHADAGELASLAARLRPRRIVLVHGDEDARQGLAQSLTESRQTVLAPENGQELDFSFLAEGGRGKSAAYAAATCGAGAQSRPGGPPDLAVLWDELTRKSAARHKLYSAEELAVLWYGKSLTPEGQVQMKERLDAEQLYFAADWKHPYFYALRRTDQVAADKLRTAMMESLTDLPGQLVLVREGAGSVRAGICCGVDQLGFNAWKVGREGAWHPAESLLEIIGPWYEPEAGVIQGMQYEALAAEAPPAPLPENLARGEQKQRLHRFLLKVKPLYRRLKPQALWEQMRDLAQEPLSLTQWRDLLALDADLETLTALGWRLNSQTDYFSRQFTIGSQPLYGCRPETPGEQPETPETSEADEELADRMEQNAALAEADKLLGQDSGLYRKGLDFSKGELTLYFHFPVPAAQRYESQIEELGAVTGWSVRIHPEAHHGALADVARQLLPAAWELLRNPSIHRENEQVSVRCHIPPGEEELALELERQFRVLTGQQLVIEASAGVLHAANAGWADDAAGAANTANAAAGGTANGAEHQDCNGPASGAMEINAAYAAIRAQLQQSGVKVYKVGKKAVGHGEYIEVSFISPDIGARYREQLDCLQEQTGWPLRVNPHPNQNEIKSLVRSLMEPAWGLVKEPGFFEKERLLRVKLKNPPAGDDARWKTAVEKISLATGYALAYV
ncbi:MAG: MBL fold metallo-hydrolase [Firmicutes bacterium]|nr:MBL fold metallo-hydrolase [Bacillota bacterium]